MNIYLYDHNMLDANGEKKDLELDSGRTGVIRKAIAAIKAYVIFNAYGLVYNENNKIDDLVQPYILFLHANNTRAKELVENNAPVSNSWIICYAGGSKDRAAYNNLPEKETSRFFEFIGDDVESKWDIPAFVSAVLGKKENAFDYLVRKPNSHLIALSILCQGYLAAHGGEGLDGWDRVPQDVKNKAAEKLEDAGDERNPTKKLWWKSALGKDNQSTTKDELKAVPDDKDIKKDDVQNLITAIYTNSDPMPDGNLVAKAYSALKSIL